MSGETQRELVPLPRLRAGYNVISEHHSGWRICCVEGRKSIRCVQIGDSGWLCDNRERRGEGQRGARRLRPRKGRPRLLGGVSYPRVSRSWS